MLVPYQHPPTTPIECPQCRRHSIVKHGESEYICLNCDFRRDLSQQPTNGADGNLLLGLLAFALTLLVGSLVTH